VSATLETAPAAAGRQKGARRQRRGASLFAYGEPFVWLMGGSLAMLLVMILGLLALVVGFGGLTFWPAPLVELTLRDGRVALGEVTAAESYRPEAHAFDHLGPEAAAAAQAEVAARGGTSTRRLLRTGNYDLTGTHFQWFSDFEVERQAFPEWALVVERQSWGRFYGTPVRFEVGEQATAGAPEQAWRQYQEHHAASRERWRRRVALERHAVGELNRRLTEARLRVRQAELDHGAGSPELERAAAELALAESESAGEFQSLQEEIGSLDAANARYRLVLRTADGAEQALELSEIVRAYPANRLGLGDELAIYAGRLVEFLAGEPREANSEGGVRPAIFGTVAMTLIMALLVVPFGVLAALFLREYARPGPVSSIVRVAINNLAGVPSIVFGVFGLGFFCYILGTGIDGLFYEASLPNPTFGKGGLLWASLTLALLTLPVVIVPTEEALAAVPSSMREGSYACGATKWQTIRRIVLPRAMPGIMTGMILALARGAGEVAPLMLVGAVKLAPELPVDGEPPFVHPSRSFMHLGFHIYDLGFQSQNSEAAKPMVYTTTLLLIAIVVVLNLLAIWIRARLRRRFQGAYV
jgi:phosphate transport system permease protein